MASQQIHHLLQLGRDVHDQVGAEWCRATKEVAETQDHGIVVHRPLFGRDVGHTQQEARVLDKLRRGSMVRVVIAAAMGDKNLGSELAHGSDQPAAQLETRLKLSVPRVPDRATRLEQACGRLRFSRPAFGKSFAIRRCVTGGAIGETEHVEVRPRRSQLDQQPAGMKLGVVRVSADDHDT